MYRAAHGERITITPTGQAVAELRPLPRQPLAAETLVERRRRLPTVDADALRADLDEVVVARL